ncbi:putative capsular polysaccharide synthesis family protein [Salinibacter altiplanensis]|uniref:putative capsular polysaccharide synthesis family protein n=1 Tax=Salinibacter altiplanensis TaxID=1803181 RepID=UPI00131A5727|nr:putative capsular polysaccharide synthesis family protein [Salinibacter altiplanensis]
MERFTETGKDFPLHFYVGRLLRWYLELTSHRIKVITLVRDPVARYISAQFQTLDHEPIPQDDPDAAVRQLQDTVRRGRKVRFDWFEREMKTLLGVNPLAEPFDREVGYSLLNAPRADILVLKLECLSDLIPGVVSSFVGKELSVVQANRGNKKDYADYYQEVLKRLQLTEETCREVYSHEHVTHFYTSGEIDQFVQKWTDQSAVRQT